MAEQSRAVAEQGRISKARQWQNKEDGSGRIRKAGQRQNKEDTDMAE